MKICRCNILFCATLGFFSVAHAQEAPQLSDTSVPVVKHSTRVGVKFPQPTAQSPYNGLASIYEPSPVSPAEQHPRERYNPDATQAPLPVFAICSGGATGLIRVNSATIKDRQADVLIYSKSDSKQRIRASEYPGRKLGYANQGYYLPTNIEAAAEDFQALTWRIGCLPTRIRVLDTGDAVFFEYREGDNAWDYKAKPSNPGPAPTSQAKPAPAAPPAAQPSPNASKSTFK